MTFETHKYIPNDDICWLPNTHCDFNNAKWISLQNNELKNTYFLARKVFNLDQIPDTTIIHISADLFYKLYINDHFVDFGPIRNTVNAMTYRSLEVSCLMNHGLNTIAVEVYQNLNQVYLHQCYKDIKNDASPCVERMALIVQLDFTSIKPLDSITSGADWKVLNGDAWEPEAILSSPYSQAEIFHAIREPYDWKKPGFDDGNWWRPGLNSGTVHHTEMPAEYQKYSFLEAAIIPPLNRSIVSAQSVIKTGEVTEIDGTIKYDIAIKMGLESLSELRTCKIENPENLLLPNDDPTIVMNAFPYDSKLSFYSYWENHPDSPEVRHASIVLDFGELINGHFLLDVAAESGVLDIAWSQVLIDGKVAPKLYLSETQGQGRGFNLSYACRYVLAKGRNQWESFHYQQFRYVQITFRYMTSPIKIHGFYAVKAEARFNNSGSFSCSNEILTWLWMASKNTLQLCTHDLPMDNIIRERGIYSGDIASALAISGPFCFGKVPALTHIIRMFTRDRILKRFLLPVLDAHLTKPVEGGDLYFCHPLYFSLALMDTRYHLDDQTAVHQDIYPTFLIFAEYLKSKLNAQGVAEDLPGTQWVDWADVDNEIGIGAPQNILISLFFKNLAKMAVDNQDTELAESFQGISDTITEYIFTNFWNENECLYVDCLVENKQRTRVFSEQSNYLALLADLGKNGRQELILKHINLDKENRVRSDISFFMVYAVKALFGIGRSTEALNMMAQRYNRIRRTGSETLWEEWSNLMSIRKGTWFARYRSAAQCGAAAQAGILSSEVLGIKALQPHFKEFLVKPQTGDLEWAKGTVATPTGTIEVTWKKTDMDIILDVSVPIGTSAIVHLPSIAPYTLNGLPLPEFSKSSTKYSGAQLIELCPGIHRLAPSQN